MVKAVPTTFPTLYKKTATGAIQQWEVFVHAFGVGGEVVTQFGQVGGELQTTTDYVKEGKNLGKKNATTALEQAALQAKQAWDKKRKAGYTENLKLAQSTDNVLDAIKPMLAHVYEDHPSKVVWPAYVQAKLDGMRCIAIVTNGKCKLYSRTQKLIETMPHIIRELERLSEEWMESNLILDGELYSHALSDDFNKIMSIAKRSDLHPEHELVQYHVYDIPSCVLPFKERCEVLSKMFRQVESESVKEVQTYGCDNEGELALSLESLLLDGYEGLMYRNPNSYYENKRSHGLLKVKTFRDEEFEVVDVEEGKGKLQGKAGAIWCVTKEGKRFKAKMQGTLESLTDYLVNFESYKGRMLTVKFQNYTPDGIPRFGVGIRFREEE